LQAKAVAYESSATFFCISAASLTSKYVSTLIATRLANRPGMAGIVPELTHGVPCPGRGSFCPGNVKVDHRAWIYGQKCTKTVATELLLLAQICNKSFVGWGFAPYPTGGVYSAPPGLLAGLRGGAPEEREGGRGGEKEGGEGREGRGGSPGMLKSRVGKQRCFV